MKKVYLNRVYELVLTCNGNRIIRYTSIFLLAVALVGCGHSGSKSKPSQRKTENFSMSDTNRLQIAVCEKLLDECEAVGVLDNKGVEAYQKIAQHPSVSRYMELIEECENEDIFYDTVGEGEAWSEYCEYVLSPHGKCCIK